MTISREAKAIIAKHVGHPTEAQRACMRAGIRLTMGQVRHAMERFAEDAPMRMLDGTVVDLRDPWRVGNAEVSGCLRAPMPEDAPRTAAGSPLDRPVGPVAGA